LQRRNILRLISWLVHSQRTRRALIRIQEFAQRQLSSDIAATAKRNVELSLPTEERAKEYKTVIGKQLTLEPFGAGKLDITEDATGKPGTKYMESPTGIKLPVPVLNPSQQVARALYRAIGKEPELKLAKPPWHPARVGPMGYESACADRGRRKRNATCAGATSEEYLDQLDVNEATKAYEKHC